MADQIDMPREVRIHLEREMKGKTIQDFKVVRVLGAGNTAVTYEVKDSYGFSWALKLVTRESYGQRPSYREVARFAGVKDDRFLVFPKETGDWTFHHGKKRLPFIWFKSRMVVGDSLERFLAGPPFTPRTEVRRFIENLTVALDQLKQIGLAHGDLHGRNIMREVVGEGGLVPEIRYVVIDFSEAHLAGDTNEGLLEDLQEFGKHLRRFSDSIYRREDLSTEDERILKALEHLPGLLNGVTADSVRLWNPDEILRTFLDTLRSIEEVRKKLRTPFDSLNAEDITDDALLAKLCFTPHWWAEELAKPGNVLLVGPRGCGKSMMFRRHRLKTKIAAKRSKELKSDLYAGFHIPCESVFFNRISDLSESIVDRYGEALVLFFNMAITAEVTSTLGLLPESLGPISRGGVEALRQLLDEEIGELSQNLGFRGALLDVSELQQRADRVMRWIRRAIAYGEKISAKGSIDYIARLVDTVKREVPFLTQRLFIFFLDDYTQERVPLALQRILHPIVCQRSGQLCFKISAHMFGSMYSYPQPLPLDEGRNINVINLGSEYVNPKNKKAEREALITIMNTRFEQCEEYKGPLESWLGHSVFPGNKGLNRALNNPDTREKVKYNGIECLQQLCSGDISEMIRMVRDIFRVAEIQGGSPRQIPAHQQDKAIRSISRDFLSRVRHIRPDGQNLFDILNAFGSLSKRLLYERAQVGQGKDHLGKRRTDPYDLLTMYVDDLTKSIPEARHIWERLQQASIFFDIRLAPSQRAVIADRVTLRRIYCPAFATTLTSSEHLQLTKGQFEWFMTKPDEFCAEYLRRNMNLQEEPTLWDSEVRAVPVNDEQDLREEVFPHGSKKHDFVKEVPERLAEATKKLPNLQEVRTAIEYESTFDAFIGAMGFEERTYGAAAVLVEKRVTAKKAFLLEFDMYYKATEARREEYESLLATLTGQRPIRPINAPVGNRDPLFPARLKDALASLGDAERPRILFDCTSCPALILSKCLGVLLEFPCDLTILYSEANEYYPTRAEWESGKLRRKGRRVEGPFSGVRFVEKPPQLQSDDTFERPILLVLFPTFNTERTSGILTELEPAKRVWIFGEPHDMSRDSYRVAMAKTFAAPLLVQGDEWSTASTFDYRKTMDILGAIYARERHSSRFVVMPHGSKMQTLGVSLFAAAHQVSMVFAVPQTYDPVRYSNGCKEAWAIPLGDTRVLADALKAGRAINM